ncbi:MAG: hypothetical protein H8F28_00665 [Fibrella sp.]|nr:hypothetical protein [Armatimonadota bacterium]
MVKNVTITVCSILLISGVVTAPATSQTVVSSAADTSPKKKSQGVPTFVREVKANGMIAGIRVKVNGALVNFGAGEPVESDGRILVPMRGVFEALGAEVKYNSETQMIQAVRGATTIALRPGEESAQVNGETRPLESPAQIVNGAAVVPLRFVSEALGAKVKWNPETLEVTVSTAALGAMKLPVAPNKNAVVGMLTGIYPEAKMVTVRLPGGTNVRVPLTYDVSATRRTIGAGLPINATTASSPVFSADAVKIGEQVQVEMNEEGEGLLILVNTDLRRGEVKAIEPLPTSGGAQVTLADGSVITMIPDALVRFQNRPVPIDTIKPAEQVVIRLNEKGEGAALAVLTPGATNMIPPLPGTVPDPAPVATIPASNPVTTPKATPVQTPKPAPTNTSQPKPVVPAPEPAPDRPPA